LCEHRVQKSLTRQHVNIKVMGSDQNEIGTNSVPNLCYRLMTVGALELESSPSDVNLLLIFKAFKIKKTAQLKKLMDAYVAKIGVDAGSVYVFHTQF
jgi:hypothetical protein